ncbi:MAG TPA: flagella basal body P-ring formation protein FlgA [Candidatus Binatia bacterium]|nr:flagella basal body P-ring formation protein FlgA [Candidatus Binatia bacterium]
MSVRRLATKLLGSIVVLSSLACASCVVRGDVEMQAETLTLKDLLGPGCAAAGMYADRMVLGRAPRAGVVRILRGEDVRRVFSDSGWSAVEVPERIAVRRGGEAKTCGQIAGLLSAQGGAVDALDCAGAQSVPRNAELELVRASWNRALERWEYALRCARAEQCVPFLVWAKDANRTPEPGRTRAARQPDSVAHIVTPGQSATLVWDDAGIRVTVPVICLEGGAVGATVRVRVKNGPEVLRAVVTGAHALRVQS